MLLAGVEQNLIYGYYDGFSFEALVRLYTATIEDQKRKELALTDAMAMAIMSAFDGKAYSRLRKQEGKRLVRLRAEKLKDPEMFEELEAKETQTEVAKTAEQIKRFFKPVKRK